MNETPIAEKTSPPMPGLRVAVASGLLGLVLSAYWTASNRPAARMVLRTRAALPAGHRLEEADLEAMPWPDTELVIGPTLVPQDRRGFAVGQKLRHGLSARAPLTWGDLALPADAMPLADTESALTISLAGVPHNLGSVRPGDQLVFELLDEDAPQAKVLRCGPFRVVETLADRADLVTIAVPWGAGVDDTSLPLRKAVQGRGFVVLPPIHLPAAERRLP